MKKNDSASSESSERIYKAATTLFAHNGYNGTSIRDIARAVGLSVSTVNYHVGGKETLYREILRRTFLMESEIFSTLTQNGASKTYQSLDELKDFFKRFAERFLERILIDPDTFRLWTFHYLESSQELNELDKEFSLPFYTFIFEQFQRAREAGLIHKSDEFIKLYITSASWMLHGYFNGRKNNWGAEDYDPFHPNNLHEFKEYLMRYLDRFIE